MLPPRSIRSLPRLSASALTRRLAVLTLPLVLAACTGTEEATPALRLVVLTDGGSTLRSATVGGDSATPAPAEVAVPVTGGVTLDPLPGGTTVALTRTAGIESRPVNLASATAFAALPFTQVCLFDTATSAARDRLLTLSACGGGPQQLALYRSDGTLIWTATLPTFTPPLVTGDTPPVRLAVLGDRGVVARPALAGGSETLVAVAATTGDVIATVSLPQPTATIRDLAVYGSSLLAATDSGVLPLNASGVPDSAGRLAAFGPSRVDRLWAGATGTRTLLAVWRDNVNAGTGSEALRLWDGVRSSAATVALVDRLRDVTLAPNGNLYALTPNTLTGYDTVFGLQQGNWRPTPVLSGLTNALAVTWVVP